MRRRLAMLCLLSLLAGGLGAWMGWHRATHPTEYTEHDALIQASARRYALDVNLLRALVMIESSGRANAVSRAGAKGLLQLVEKTAKQEALEYVRLPSYDSAMLFEPETNLRLGASYLSRLLKRYQGDEHLALAAYNAGMGNVGRWCARAADAPGAEVVEREGFRETRLHVRRVLTLRDHYRTLSGDR